MKTPAEIVIRELRRAGVSMRAIARHLDIAPSTVLRWPKSRAEGGTDGLIPSRYHRDLLALARRNGAALSADDLVYGRR